MKNRKARWLDRVRAPQLLLRNCRVEAPLVVSRDPDRDRESIDRKELGECRARSERHPRGLSPQEFSWVIAARGAQRGQPTRSLRRPRARGIQPRPRVVDDSWQSNTTLRIRIAKCGSVVAIEARGSRSRSSTRRLLDAKRATGFEPVTSCLEGKNSTAELRPQ